MMDLEWEDLGKMNLAGQYRGQNPMIMKDGISGRVFLVRADRKLAPGLTSAVYDTENEFFRFTGAANSFANVVAVEEVLRIALPVWPSLGNQVRQLEKDEGEMP